MPPPLLLLLLQVDLTVNLVERKTGGLGAGTGISAAGRGSGNMPGFVGNFTYR
jgi:outer membrane protein insertion porin family